MSSYKEPMYDKGAVGEFNKFTKDKEPVPPLLSLNPIQSREKDPELDIEPPPPRLRYHLCNPSLPLHETLSAAL